LILALTLAGFGALVPIEGAVIAPAEVADGAPQPIQHAEGGTVAKILVAEGQGVEPGQTLALIDTDALRVEAQDIGHQRMVLGLRRAVMAAEAGDRPAPDFSCCADKTRQDANERAAAAGLFEARWAAHRAALGAIETERDGVVARLDGLARERRAANERLGIALADNARLSPLVEKGLASKLQLATLARDIVDARATLARIRTAEVEARARLPELVQAVRRLSADRRAAAQATLAAIAEEDRTLAARLAALERRIPAGQIRAPAAGRLSGPVPAPGRVLGAGEVAFVLVPAAAERRFRARVAPAQMARVHVGQTVRLKMPTALGAIATEWTGRVVDWSAAPLTDERSGVVYYEVTIAADKPDGGEAQPNLVPAMAAEAYFVTEPRTILSFVGRALTDYFGRAFREG